VVNGGRTDHHAHGVDLSDLRRGHVAAAADEAADHVVDSYSACRRAFLSSVGGRVAMSRILGGASPTSRPGGVRMTNMRIDHFTFGSIRVDGITYRHDVVIDRGDVRERKKGPSKRFRDICGHTPLSIEERIPWDCRRLVIGTGADGALPVMDEVRRKAARRKVELVVTPTAEAIRALDAAGHTNAVLHVTC
jgi:hypothetical protein